jgi:hypothetical protein
MDIFEDKNKKTPSSLCFVRVPNDNDFHVDTRNAVGILIKNLRTDKVEKLITLISKNACEQKQQLTSNDKQNLSFSVFLVNEDIKNAHLNCLIFESYLKGIFFSKKEKGVGQLHDCIFVLHTNKFQKTSAFINEERLFEVPTCIFTENLLSESKQFTLSLTQSSKENTPFFTTEIYTGSSNYPNSLEFIPSANKITKNMNIKMAEIGIKVIDLLSIYPITKSPFKLESVKEETSGHDLFDLFSKYFKTKDKIILTLYLNPEKNLESEKTVFFKGLLLQFDIAHQHGGRMDGRFSDVVFTTLPVD